MVAAHNIHKMAMTLRVVWLLRNLVANFKFREDRKFDQMFSESVNLNIIM